MIEKNIDPAQMVMFGKTLYRLADLSTVWINADTYEYELPYVKVGQKVQVTAPGASGSRLRCDSGFHLPLFGKQNPHDDRPAGDEESRRTIQAERLRQRGD